MSVTSAAKFSSYDPELQDQEAKLAVFSGGKFRRLKVDDPATDAEPNVKYNSTREYAIQLARCSITQLEPLLKSNRWKKEAFAIVAQWIEIHK